MITSEIAAYSLLRLGRNLADVGELEDFVDKSFIAREILQIFRSLVDQLHELKCSYKQSYEHIRDHVYTIFT